jgi:hypothetical protein
MKVCEFGDDYDSLMCGLLGHILACPCGPCFKEVFTLTRRLRDPETNVFLDKCLLGEFLYGQM